MKHLIIAMFFTTQFFSQSGTLDMQLLNVKVKHDTLAQQLDYNLVFDINIQNIQHAKSLTVSVLDENGTLIGQLDSYNFIKHSLGFYYIENANNLKITVAENKISFLKQINSVTYLNCRSVKIEYKSNDDLIKSINGVVVR